MNVKPGDLAIVIRVDGEENRDAIGLIVEVMCAAHASDWTDADQPEWQCRARAPFRARDMRSGAIVLSSEFDVKDSWLRPISGVPVTDDVEDEVTA
ncbi:hypothetical protein [Burkholderia cenocepacia]|uniref:hypothetical protein n=1 Tax=Burkholderia cenocepacia TaxID=95486 RepID=UPI000F5AA772|nr:hypothetical protein [Burkholderia cenocepacia]RQV56110.1 hypothetical protein DF020_19930 [Burkholderia cenocepacia]